MEDIVIHFENVSKTYKLKGNKSKEALNSVSFDIAQGDIVGLIGLNGAGKSTTVKLLTGIMAPSSGSISVLGFTPHRERKKLCQHYGVMFGQRTNLWWDLPLRDSLYIFGKMYGINKKKLTETIAFYEKKFDLPFLDTPARQLSFGQRVMGDILLSVIHNPKVLFLDEATIALDVFNRKKILELIYEINALFHTTIIMTSHILTDIEAICNKILLLNSGHLCFNGSIRDFMSLSNKDRKVELLIDDEQKRLYVMNSFNDLFTGKIVSSNSKICILCSSENGELLQAVNHLNSYSDIDVNNYTISNITLEDRLLYLME